MQLLEAAGSAAVWLGKLLKYMHESKITAMKAEWKKAVDKGLKEKGYK